MDERKDRLIFWNISRLNGIVKYPLVGMTLLIYKIMSYLGGSLV